MTNGSHQTLERPYRLGLAFLALLFLALTAIRIAAPDDLGFRDQNRPVSYICDVVQNDRWLCPRDASGGMASKPPLHPWIGAVVGVATGGVNRFAWLFPSILGMAGITYLLYSTGVRRTGWRTGFLAATIFLVSPLGSKMIGMVRTDSLFAWLVLLNALAALRAWETGRGWGWFWFVSFLTTMTKGPLGVLLAVCGLLAVVWEKRSDRPIRLRGTVWPGALVWAGTSLLWLWLAWREMGDEVINEIIGRELLRHAVLGDDGEIAGSHFYDTPFYFLTRFVPWSFVAIAGIVRVVSKPAKDESRRRFDRFMTCWVVAGLVIFSMAGHQRPYLIFPLVPPAAWLAAGVLADLRWLATRRRVLAFATGIAVITTPFVAWAMFVVYPRDPWVQRGLAAKRIARQVDAELGEDYPLAYESMGLENQRGVWRKLIPREQSVRLLGGDAPAFVSTIDGPGLVAACAERGIDARVVLSIGEQAVVGNRDELGWYDPMGAWLAPFRLTARGVRHDGGKTYYLSKTDLLINGGVFLIDGGGGSLIVRNTASREAVLRLDLRQDTRSWREEHVVGPEASVRLVWPGRVEP